MGSRYQGRKNKPTPRSNNDQCDYKVGAILDLIYVRRKDPKPGERKVAQIPVVKGGTRCKNPSLISKATGERRCEQHLCAIYPISNS